MASVVHRSTAQARAISAAQAAAKAAGWADKERSCSDEQASPQIDTPAQGTMPLHFIPPIFSRSLCPTYSETKLEISSRQ